MRLCINVKLTSNSELKLTMCNAYQYIECFIGRDVYTVTTRFMLNLTWVSDVSRLSHYFPESSFGHFFFSADEKSHLSGMSEVLMSYAKWTRAPTGSVDIQRLD